jgi:hypothetical protein
MKNEKGPSRPLFSSILLIGITGIILTGCFWFPKTEKWKEEVQLSDGKVIVVERATLRERGGGEIVSNRSGTKPKEYHLRFAHPDGSGKMIEWRSTKWDDRRWPEVPLILDIESGKPIIYAIVGIRVRCEAYSKYVYRDRVWIEETLSENFEMHITNLFLKLGIDMPSFVDLETKRKVNSSKSYSKSLRQVGPTRQVCE